MQTPESPFHGSLSPLRDYQAPHALHVLDRLRMKGVFLDDSETGTGKTFIALWVAKRLGVIPLVIGPKTTRISWQRAADIVGVGIEYTNYEKARGTRKRKEDGSQGPAESEWAYEVPSGSGSKLIFKAAYEMIIFDEVHRCGGMTSLNSKLLMAARKACRYLLMMSATAIDDPRQMKALGRVLGIYDSSKGMGFYGWLLSHGCTPGIWGGFDLTKKPEKLQAAFTKIRQEIFPDGRHGLRRSEIPAFPKTRIEQALLDPTDKAERLIEEIQELYLKRQLQEATAVNKLEEIIRKRQMLEAMKIPDLVELAQEHGQRCPVCIFVSFVDTVDLLHTKLTALKEGRVEIIDGRQTGDKGEIVRQQIIDAFQANLIKYLVINAAAGGEGISLQDPTGAQERVSLIMPIQSGKRLVQIFGRPQRDSGGFSTQFLVTYANTYEETVADRVIQKVRNLETLTDSDLM